MHPFPPMMHRLSRRFSQAMPTGNPPGRSGRYLQVAKSADVFRPAAQSAWSGATARIAPASLAAAICVGVLSTVFPQPEPCVFPRFSAIVRATAGLCAIVLGDRMTPLQVAGGPS
jgi:hypothetical protein